jgi:hypothetical protein
MSVTHNFSNPFLELLFDSHSHFTTAESLGSTRKPTNFEVGTTFLLSLVGNTLYFLLHGSDIFLSTLAASLATNELWVNELESKLRAGNRALE